MSHGDRQTAAAMRLVGRQWAGSVCATVRSLRHRGIPVEASAFFMSFRYLQHLKVDNRGQDWSERRTLMPWDRLRELKHLQSVYINERWYDLFDQPVCTSNSDTIYYMQGWSFDLSSKKL